MEENRKDYVGQQSDKIKLNVHASLDFSTIIPIYFMKSL